MIDKFKNINPYRITLVFLLLLTTLAACQAGTPRKPDVVCAETQHLTLSALCLKAITTNFGPADELVGYSPIVNLSALMLAEGIIAPQQPSAESLQEMGAGAKATDEQGNLTLFIEPGEYVLCVFRISPNEFPESLAACEQITVVEGGPTKILIQHSPMGGLITFEQYR